MADPQKITAALKFYESNEGLAPYGLRHTGDSAKGKGYFGMLPHAGGSFSTEISSESDINGKNTEYPLLVPTLNATELQHLLSGNDPTSEIYKKAEDYATQRIKLGKSPFAQPNELRYPTPNE